MADTPGRYRVAEKVFVAMSGGVDSSVAALLLRRAGYEVVGITFKLFASEDLADEAERPCCSLDNVIGARSVCHQLGVPHYVMSFTEQFGREVIDRFVAEYGSGRTPNPCVLCNRHIKFDSFLSKALAIGADFIATGHHARLRGEESRHRLLPAVDLGKDQSYALAHLNQSVMPRLLLPIGEYTKAEVRQLASEAGLPTAETQESQDICFVGQGRYADFLAARNLPVCPGPIVNRAGEVLGEHRGLQCYTVGQRKNLAVSVGRRLYVTEKRLADNALVVGDLAEVWRAVVTVEEVNWCDLPAGEWPEQRPEGVAAMLRYRQAPIPCTIEAAEPLAGRVVLRLETPAVAAPGQLVALYDQRDGRVVMGGTIVQGA